MIPPAGSFLPRSPREYFEEGLPPIPLPRQISPTAQDVMASQGDFLDTTKEFFVELTPKPLDVAEAGAEMASSTVGDRARTVATVATPILIPVAVIGGAGLIAISILGGSALAGAGLPSS